MNSIAIVNDSAKLIDDFENSRVSEKEFLNKLKQKNKKIKTNYENFTVEFGKIQKSFENINNLISKDIEYVQKNEITTKALIESIVKEIKEVDFDRLIEYEKQVEEMFKFREKEYGEFRKKANNLRYVKYSLNNFMEKINKI